MSIQERALAHERTQASEKSRWRQMNAGLEPESSEVSDFALDIRSMIGAVSRSISLDTIELSDAFFPAHLSVALIEAVFGSGLRYEAQPESFAERYCRHFGIARTRADRWEFPPIDDQETLEDLIAHYDELGVNGMASKVFHTRRRVPGTRIARAGYVLRVANGLRRIGVAVLQDLTARPLREIDDALRSLPGNNEDMVRLLLMYASDDQFVWGDVHVRSFVARAIGRRTVSAARAVKLVRRCAHELILAPRYLDYHIWRCGVSRPAAPPPETGLQGGGLRDLQSATSSP